jgi:hypothetical protein
MADRHYRRTREVVRVGGLNVGNRVLGGHLYSVGPLSVADASALIQILAQLGGVWPKVAEDAMAFARAAPTLVLRPLVPLLIEGRLETKGGKAIVVPCALSERDRRRMKPLQVLRVLEAAAKVNDLDFIFAGFLDKKEGTERISVERLVDRFVLRYHCYTHHDVWAMPMQEFLAIIESWRAESEATEDAEAATPDGWKKAEMTDEDVSLLKYLGLVN